MSFVVSLHIPKTAGTTLVDAYTAVYGSRFLYHNETPDVIYGLDPEEARRRYDLVHGHIDLSLLKSLIDDRTKLVTFLRDPVERVASSYHYHLLPVVTGEIAELVRGQNLSLRDFADMADQQNLQHRMLYPFERERFDFVGVAEQFPRSLDLLSQVLNVSLPNPAPRNHNRAKPVGQAYDIDAETRAFILERNTLDQELYDWACRTYGW